MSLRTVHLSGRGETQILEYGASSPNAPWKKGKTAATLVFVDEAEACLRLNKKLNPTIHIQGIGYCLTRREQKLLSQKITKLKSGKEELDHWVTVADFLELTRN